MLKITRTGNRYSVETPNGRLHILNERSLKWNLKNVFGLSGEECLSVIMILDQDGTIEFNFEEVAA